MIDTQYLLTDIDSGGSFQKTDRRERGIGLGLISVETGKERRERERDTWKVPGSNLRIQSFPKIKPLSTPDHGWVHS